MSAASRFTSLSVIVVGVAGWAAPAAARPFLKFKIKHFIPTMSVDLGKGRALDVSALGPVHVSGDRGFVGGVVNTTSDPTQPAATLLQKTAAGIDNFLQGPDKINETIRHGFEGGQNSLDALISWLKTFVATASVYGIVAFGVAIVVSVILSALITTLTLRRRLAVVQATPGLSTTTAAGPAV